MSVNFRGAGGINQSFFSERIKPQGQTATELQDGILSNNDYSSLKSEFIASAVASGATAEAAGAEFDHMIADALDGQLDDTIAGGEQTTAKVRELAKHEGPANALNFRPAPAAAGEETPTLPVLGRLRNLSQTPGQDQAADFTAINPSAPATTPPATDPNANTPSRQGVAQIQQNITDVQGLIGERDLLAFDIPAKERELSSLRRSSSPTIEVTENGVTRRVPKAERIQALESQLGTMRGRLQELRGQNLEARRTAAYAEILPPQNAQGQYITQGPEAGPFVNRIQEINTGLTQLMQDPELSRWLSEIDIAKGNNAETVTLDGQSYTIADAEARLQAMPKMQQINQLTQELASIETQLKSWQDNMSNDTRQAVQNVFIGAGNETSGVVNTSGALLSRTWNAVKSKAGMNWALPDVRPMDSPSGTQRNRDMTHNVLSYFGTAAGIGSMIASLPPSAQAKLTELLTKLSATYGPKALEKLATIMSTKMATAAGVAFSAYGAAYYGSIATGLNYPNVSIGDATYELRPSTATRAIAGLAATLDGLAAGATATGAGAGVGLALGVLGMIGECAAEFSLMQDQEKLEAVVNNVMNAPDGPAVMQGLDRLRQTYGSLENIQDVLGQVPLHQSDNPPQWNKGDVVTTEQMSAFEQAARANPQQNPLSGKTVDRDLVGAVMNKILEAGVNGPPPKPAEVRTAIAEMMKGLDERWTSDDDATQSFFNQIGLRFGDSPEKFQKAVSLLGSDVRLKMFKMLDEGITTGSNLAWLGLDEHSSDLSEAAVIEALAGAESDPRTKGQMIALLYDGVTRERFEDLSFKLIEDTRAAGLKSGNLRDFNRLIDSIKIDGRSLLQETPHELSPERAGKVLAWMVQGLQHETDAGKKAQRVADINTFITEASGKWFADDNITVALLDELKALKIPATALKDIVPQSQVLAMFRNLEGGWTTPQEYVLLERLALAATPETRATMVADLMSGATFDRAEQAIKKLIDLTPPDQQRRLFDRVDMHKLGAELETTGDAADVLKMLTQTGVPADKINSFVDGVSTQGWLNGKDDDLIRTLMGNLGSREIAAIPDSVRLRFFKALDGGDTSTQEYTLMQTLANASSPATKAEMINYLLAQDPTVTAQENIIYETLRVTPYEGRQFLDVVSHLNTGQLAEELESNGQASQVAVWLAKAYHQAGQASGAKLDDFLLNLAHNHRDEAINGFVDHADVKANGRELYKRIPAATIQQMATKLMNDGTDEAEEDCIMKLLDNTSWDQLRAVFDRGGNAFIDQMVNDLDVEDYGKVMGWMAELGQSSKIEYMFGKIAGSDWFVDTTSDDAAYALTGQLSDATINKMPKTVLSKLHAAMDDGWTTSEEYAAMNRLKASSNW